ncbi:MAG: hypothetical protein A3H96_20330 [Acidobacteria bacterium RIFCSPLOWO2_02_FULL_67_36]|nr:MAG: hypothetical protein A3H96_20330 [Acidobacteria bacterium RIFCSPLOWO2_02_FULL_67_36]OFW23381.1 MAG: hypothetical protein A3G21_10835 [Acidobacteria bacterium RIFCSPLOWO2_12_FULL_66_21]HBQ37896.1 hypothetical protein [Candidatus Omnitrophota bacterium]
MQQPIIVHVVEPPVESTTIGDVLIGAFGLTGVLILVALLLGAVLGGALIGFKLLRARRGADTTMESDVIHISPYV